MTEGLWNPNKPYEIVGVSKAAEALRVAVEDYKIGMSPVIILGETGTGKELIAQNLHRESDRTSKPFVAVNCGGLDSSLIMSELFGYRSGAFTGAASEGRKGAVEEAHEGVLFLDEIGNLCDIGQKALLRVLDGKHVIRVGAVYGRHSDFRLISATNKDIDRALADGQIQEDFYYRIKGVTIGVPPLRERKVDIPHLVRYLMSRYVIEHRMQPKEMDQAAMILLMQYNWPGNIRQLEKVIEAAMYTRSNIISPDKIEELLLGQPPFSRKEHQRSLIERCYDAGIAPEMFQEGRISVALERSCGNRKEAAKQLGMSYDSLIHYLKRFGFMNKRKKPSNGNGNGNGNGQLSEQAKPVEETVK